MMEKISVRGSSIHPVYKFLTTKKKNGYKDSFVQWNFQKYLINEDGFVEKRLFHPGPNLMTLQLLSGLKVKYEKKRI